jgi:hypothetical protein
MAGRRKKKTMNKEEIKMTKKLQELEQYEEFKQSVLPSLREMVSDGKPAQEILEQFQSYAAARLLTLAVTTNDPAKALAAIKEIFDRGIGKATEKKEITHKYDNLHEEELDALLATELSKLSDNDKLDTH